MAKRRKDEQRHLVRSTAAEYLTFITASGDGGVEAIYCDEDVWLSQKMMGGLYDVDVRTVNYHLKKCFSDSELEEHAVIRNFRITAADGKSYDTKHYNLSGIIAVGYKVNSERAVQFRKWAAAIIREFTIKGYAMDDERLKNDGSILGKRYFEEQLQRIREIGVPGNADLPIGRQESGPVWPVSMGTGIFATNDITSNLWRISTTTPSRQNPALKPKSYQ